ncbi:MAG: TetR/AcrR family transcriptional regulator [Myxococcaceae bacterium]
MAKAAKAQGETPREVERRKTILRAAVEVFARKGYHGCRIADVAKEAGVAYGLVYHYFKNKEELLDSVFQAGWTAFVDRIKASVAAGGSLEERVRRVASVAFDAYKHDPRGVRVLILEIARSPGSGRVNRASAFGEVIYMAREMFEEAQNKGELRADIDPMLCAALLFGQIEMGLTAFVLGLVDPKDEVRVERARNQISESFLHGILPTGGGANAEVTSWKSDKSATRSRAQRRS